MPTTMFGAANATGICPVETCRGHLEPRHISAELKVTYWTQRVGAGQITVSRSERHPITVADTAKICQHCGSELEISAFVNGGVLGGYHQKDGRVSPRIQASDSLTWPEPTVSPGATPDEILPDPAAERTLEERVRDLELRRRT